MQQAEVRPGMGAAVAFALAFLTAGTAPAQDVRGLEICTAEKQMDRRTSCLQSNVEFLQQVMERNARDARQKLDAASQELAAARTEIAAMKAVLVAVQARLDKIEKTEKPKADAK